MAGWLVAELGSEILTRVMFPGLEGAVYLIAGEFDVARHREFPEGWPYQFVPYRGSP